MARPLLTVYALCSRRANLAAVYMENQPFSDKLNTRIQQIQSWLVAGFDPVIDDFPDFLRKSFAQQAGTLDDRIRCLLVRFYSIAVDAIGEKIVAIKPNLAFFEQYGLGGLQALREIIVYARKRSLLIIADAKRGDIGSTAQAYANAFIGHTSVVGESLSAFPADALTVNPFLGFDTVEVFLNQCVRNGKGIFLLVKTSNPGSRDLQDCGPTAQESVSRSIAKWIGEHARQLAGSCGYSGLGAVVGATYPQELAALRTLMPSSFLLIPGMGAQGGTASDTVAGFTRLGNDMVASGAIVNVSRGLFGSLPETVVDEVSLASELARRVEHFNGDLTAVVSSSVFAANPKSPGRA